MALAHKALDVECVPWRFTEKKAISFSGQDKVPVLVDEENTVSDSWQIAKYLETEYPDSTSLKLDQGEVLFIKYLVEMTLHREMLQILIMDIYNSLTQKDQTYFRESREKILGKTLEEIVLNREERLQHFQKLLTTLRTSLEKQEFVVGATPGFSDYIVFGIFQWSRCVSDFSLLKVDDSIFLWRKKMLDLHQGLAMNTVGYTV